MCICIYVAVVGHPNARLCPIVPVSGYPGAPVSWVSRNLRGGKQTGLDEQTKLVIDRHKDTRTQEGDRETHTKKNAHIEVVLN